ncbi:hypothetical protein TrRE_jg1034 [Triparma retinervis]|uniref:Uncharacterized protein n=1 Tax=Triparma retinervis TaxID=2557542 RepID=A0A9W7ATJ7_9STRA|nr:hypothetical protein TrRE_jg1034 [Triparma retinervis]
MGTAASIEAPTITKEVAQGMVGAELWSDEKWESLPKLEDGSISKETWAEAVKPPAEASPDPAATDEIDRSEIERNANGSEEPSSADPELWNIDNTEVDILVKYKMGGQMWYVQSRMRENTAKTPAQPIPGFPMNAKAKASGRFYAIEEDLFNEE